MCSEHRVKDAELNQSGTLEHAVADFLYNISAIAFTDEHNTSPSSAHTPDTSKTVYEVDTGMGNIVEDDVADHQGINTAGPKISHDKNFCVG